MRVLRLLTTRLGRRSHAVACHNALTASRTLAVQARERAEVAEFLARHRAEGGLRAS